MATHTVELSNGKVIVLKERARSLGIYSRDGMDENRHTSWFLARIEQHQIVVAGNSNDATFDLLEGLRASVYCENPETDTPKESKQGSPQPPQVSSDVLNYLKWYRISQSKKAYPHVAEAVEALGYISDQAIADSLNECQDVWAFKEQIRQIARYFGNEETIEMVLDVYTKLNKEQ